MSKKSDFIKIIQEEIFDRPDIWSENYPDIWDGAVKYWEIVRQIEDVEKPPITERGKEILMQMQKDTEIETWSAKSLADAIGTTAKVISGGIRKLVSDGFVEKIGTNPTAYEITEKGKNFKFNEDNKKDEINDLEGENNV